jgi:hypothetical protein
MKKIASITCLLLCILASNAYSQSNLTWTLKDKGEKGFFKTHTDFNSNFSGFANKTESEKFLAKLKSNSEIASVVVSKVEENGNCDLVINMKQPHDRLYYVGLAQKLGIDYIQYNNQKKTPAEIIEQSRKKSN